MRDIGLARRFTAALACAVWSVSSVQPVLAQPQPAAPPLAAPAPLPVPVLSPGQLEIARKALEESHLEGLQPKDYLPADTEDAAALTKALLRYASDVKVGRLSPSEFPDQWSVRPAPYDPTPEFAAAVTTDRLQAWLDSLAPRYVGYVALKKGLAKYREIAANEGWQAIPDGKPMGLGSTDPRVPALRARLAAEDPQIEAEGPPIFDQPVQDAVVRAQKRFGLKPDGVVGKGALAALNLPVGHRILQTIANMERWRWMPSTMPATRIQVNSGAAIVTLFQDDKPVLSMKAVSGKPGDETPMLASTMHSIVINPPWNVPASIARNELWPKERANPGYLARNRYRVIPVEGGEPRLQQASGDDSALGRFKFDFDNRFAVYLHDTPAKAGFDNYARQASHGCVRLEKPRALAEALLRADPAWTPEAIDAALGDGSKTQRVKLPQDVPIWILYWTAFAGADGQMHFRSDPYNWDRLLLEKVGAVGAKT